MVLNNVAPYFTFSHWLVYSASRRSFNIFIHVRTWYLNSLGKLIIPTSTDATLVLSGLSGLIPHHGAGGDSGMYLAIFMIHWHLSNECSPPQCPHLA